MRIISLLIFCLLTLGESRGQSAAHLKEYLKEYKTYPFSDPDPLPNSGSIYPYYRFDGFTSEPIMKKWKIVELENDFIKILIMPEIGGKIWAAIDKTTSKSFIYENQVVKFRDIAMRGPWTSGGIEPNYGLIGHTPNCAAPVEYMTRTNNDGSVSCFISVLDRLSMTRWNLEINLPKDKSYFITRSFWHNSTSSVQPYYTWMNAAVCAKEDLQFIYPGNKYIGHNGEVSDWPLDKKTGKNLSNYAENNFGISKSYHVTGTHSKYFGTYWKNEDYGMMHFAERDEKLGKKLFLWALSDNGKIWEELLTDHDGQYAEVQSGRLFNQNFPKSSFTPFKQLGFAPYQSDVWSEYWYPFSHTKGVTEAGLTGVFNFKQDADSLHIYISPVATVDDSLRIYGKSGGLLYWERLRLKPLIPYHKAIYLKNAVAEKVTLNGETVGLSDAKEDELSRPLTHPKGFDWKSSYGLYLQGRDLVRFRNHDEAEIKLRQSISANPLFMPALTEMAAIQYFKMNYDSAYHFAKRAMSIDAYEPSANFYYALSATKLGKWADALDGFEVAGLNPGFNSAAATELSRLYLSRKNFTKAYEYASKSLAGNDRNLSGLQLQYLAARLLNKETSAIKAKILSLEPLNHFVRFEAYLARPREDDKEAFMKYINGEAPEETFLDLAAWYFRAGCLPESRKVLELAPANSELLFWRAYLSRDEKGGDELLRQANQSSALLVFPYLAETVAVMEWARQQNADWKPVYYLSLIYKFRNDKEKARALLEGVKTPVDFAPFYAYRSALIKGLDKKLEDLHLAAAVGPRQWRYGNMLAEHYIRSENYARALEIIRPYAQENSSNYITGMVYIRALLLNEHYNEAEKELSKIHILPFEDATYGRSLYRQTKLMLAYRALSDKNHKLALQKITEAESWPRNLGVGKPYQDLIDLSMELWLKSAVYKAMGEGGNSRKYLNSIKSATYEPGSISSLIKSQSLKQLGLVSSANATFQQWLRLQKDSKLGSKGHAFFAKGSDFGFVLKTISQKEDQRLF